MEPNELRPPAKEKSARHHKYHERQVEDENRIRKDAVDHLLEKMRNDMTGLSSRERLQLITEPASAAPRSGKQAQRARMPRAHSRKMPAIRGKDLRRVESLSGGDYRGINKPKPEIRVLPEENIRASDVLRLQRLDGELTCRNRIDESRLCLSGNSRVQEIADFRKNCHGNNDGFTI